jgi:phosphate transport system protein
MWLGMVNELITVKKELHHMWTLVRLQLRKCHSATVHFDEELAHTVLKKRKEVLEFQVLIDRHCHHLIENNSLPGAELKKVLNIMRIAQSLKRLSEIIESIAKLVTTEEQAISMNSAERQAINKIFSDLGQMLADTDEAFSAGQFSPARRIFRAYETIEATARTINKQLLSVARVNPAALNQALTFASIISKLERAAEQCTNIGEQIMVNLDEKESKQMKRLTA